VAQAIPALGQLLLAAEIRVLLEPLILAAEAELATQMAALESLWCVMQIVLLKQLQPQVLPLTRFQVAIGFINLQVLVLLLGDAMDLMEFKNGKFN
jgi:hypothetical protein